MTEQSIGVLVCVGIQVMPTIHQEVRRLGGSSFLTEFGICSPDGDAASVSTVECDFVMQEADEYLQSWTYWDSLFFNDSQHGPSVSCRRSSVCLSVRLSHSSSSYHDSVVDDDDALSRNTLTHRWSYRQ